MVTAQVERQDSRVTPGIEQSQCRRYSAICASPVEDRTGSGVEFHPSIRAWNEQRELLSDRVSTLSWGMKTGVSLSVLSSHPATHRFLQVVSGRCVSSTPGAHEPSRCIDRG